jgi:hypothetical protein
MRGMALSWRTGRHLCRELFHALVTRVNLYEKNAKEDKEKERFLLDFELGLEIV